MKLVNEKIIPVYKELKGWNASNLNGVSKDNLPAELNAIYKIS